jgi:hypothetical protein
VFYSQGTFQLTSIDRNLRKGPKITGRLVRQQEKRKLNDSSHNNLSEIFRQETQRHSIAGARLQHKTIVNYINKYIHIVSTEKAHKYIVRNISWKNKLGTNNGQKKISSIQN